MIFVSGDRKSSPQGGAYIRCIIPAECLIRSPSQHVNILHRLSSSYLAGCYTPMWRTDFFIHYLSICSSSHLRLVWNISSVVSENMLERRNDQSLQSLKSFKAPSHEHPQERSTFYCQEFYLSFSSCSCVRQKKKQKHLNTKFQE